MSYKPWYNEEADYNTNARSYMDYLARHNKFMKVLVEDYEVFKEIMVEEFKQFQLDTDETIESFQSRLDNIQQEMTDLFIDWLEDGTLETIINENIFNGKASTADLEQLRTDLMADQELLKKDLMADHQQLNTLIKSNINGLEKNISDNKKIVDTHMNIMTIIAKHKNILPNTDITIGLQNLVNELEPDTTLIFEPNATYQITNEILFTKNISLDFKNSTVEVDLPVDVVNAFKFSGEIIGEKTITTTYNSGILTLTLENTSGIKRGQTVLVNSTEAYNTSRNNYRKGGYFSIEHVTGNTIRLNQSMPVGFASGTGKVTIYNPITPVIENLKLVNKNDIVRQNTMGIRVEDSKNLHIYNVDVDGFDHNVLLRNHINSVIEKYSTGRSLYEGATQSYGLTSYTGTGFKVSQCNMRSGRHALSLTGFQPSYNTLIENSTFDNEKVEDPHSFDCHDANHSLTMINCHCNGALFAGNCHVRDTMFTSSSGKKVTLAKTNSYSLGRYTFENCHFAGIDIVNGEYKQVPTDTGAEYIGLISIKDCFFRSVTLRLNDKVNVRRIAVENTDDFKILLTGDGCIVDDLTLNGIVSTADLNIISGTKGKIRNVVVRDCYLPSRYRAIFLPLNDNLVLENVRFRKLEGIDPSSTSIETGSTYAFLSHVFGYGVTGGKITGDTVIIGGEGINITGGTVKTVTLT